MSEFEEKQSKKPRRRMRAAYTKIREQMEFYFSDANLHKDRFLKKSIQATSDGYISLDTFLQFNRIKSLTDSKDVVAEALEKKSDLLQINDARTHVRRVTPIQEPINVDERTVYVECLPTHVDHDWVRKLFSACGKVVYVSLPRYPSTGDLKGFAFVEFETIEAAHSACEELNNPPADLQKFGAFPKSSHQIESLKKKLPDEEFKEKMKDILTPAVDEHAGVDSEKSPPPGREPKYKRQKTHGECEADQGNVSNASPTKRKKSDVVFEVPSEQEDTALTPSKKKSRKRKSRSRTDDSEESKDETDIPKCVPEKKQKLNDNEENQPTEEITEPVNTEEKKENQITENSSNKKKRFRRKKAKKDTEFPELRVISKKEWLELRQEYLELQKTSMALLKKTLSGKKGYISKNDNSKKKHREIEFIPDVIVKVTADNPMNRKDLKTSLGDSYQIAYIDVKDEHLDGFIRCKDSGSAKRVCETTCPGYTFTNVKGDEEKQYWDKLISDRETKLNTKGSHKKRGQQKWMNKAQKVSIENTNRKHIVFEDD